MSAASPSTSSRMASAGSAGTAAGRAVSAAASAWLSSRGLSASILGRLPVGFGTDRGRECVFFGCVVGGEKKGYKARPLDAKEFWCKQGTPTRFWNLDQVLGSDVVYITEGEVDACSLVEAGISAEEVLSVPTGARERPAEEIKDGVPAGYGYVLEALEQGLSAAKRFVLCTDADGPGRSLRADLVKILGVARCWFVDWPDGCKDANDLLRSDGAAALRELVTAGALPWPVDGLYTLAELPEMPPMQGWDFGFSEWAVNGTCKIGSRCLSVVTGNPGHGKTAAMAQFWFQIARREGLRIAVASLESEAKPHLRKMLRQSYWRRPERNLTPEERDQADRHIQPHYHFMVHPDGRPPLRWLLDRAEVAVVRHECRAVVLDPWNKIEGDKPPGMPETDFIGQCLDEMFRFARDMNCHVMVLAHPAKVDSQLRGKPPLLEDIAGSKHWDNKPDQGFVIHRPKLSEGADIVTDADFYIRKSRFADDLGYPRKLTMRFNRENAVFEAREVA